MKLISKLEIGEGDSLHVVLSNGVSFRLNFNTDVFRNPRLNISVSGMADSNLDIEKTAANMCEVSIVSQYLS